MAVSRSSTLFETDASSLKALSRFLDMSFWLAAILALASRTGCMGILIASRTCVSTGNCFNTADRVVSSGAPFLPLSLALLTPSDMFAGGNGNGFERVGLTPRNYVTLSVFPFERHTRQAIRSFLVLAHPTGGIFQCQYTTM